MLSLMAGAAEIKPLSKDFFGISLGMSESSFMEKCGQARLSVDADAFKFKDPEYPAKVFRVRGALNGNAAVSAINAFIYSNMVYQISVKFSDSTKENFDAICKALEQKYAKEEQSIADIFSQKKRFTAKMDGVEVEIVAGSEKNFGSPDDVTVDYARMDLYEQISGELQRKKSAKISDGL